MSRTAQLDMNLNDLEMSNSSLLRFWSLKAYISQSCQDTPYAQHETTYGESNGTIRFNLGWYWKVKCKFDLNILSGTGSVRYSLICRAYINPL